MKNQSKQITNYLAFILIALLFTQSCTKEETVLSVEAALVFKSGDVKPVARTEFYLMDKNFENIMQEAEFISSISNSNLPSSSKENFSKMNGLNPLRTFTIAIKSAKVIEGFQLPIAKTLAVAKSHATYTSTTDFQGKAQFKNVKAGEYYLFGYTQVGDSVVIWNVKTEVKDGQNSIVLDQSNAETSD